ncbi:type 2 lanthipeptide synthetase LanM [Streptomyces sp. NBC_01591]|uniref:DUF4135 domain-containing protein n=1 Tax=Streptomyces sp. NBC_01591 TaxID=2975888 RepID=UPI002DD9E418|nr:DUF4135 domain-containing protein [Streptomyces sp. NBC_01591]WSD72836.1 type 2 lanthipeptide synthetase LanM [Streptomyces sp. NBC_01591]
MTNVLWQSEPAAAAADSAPQLPPAAREIVEAIRSGTASGLFPPVLRSTQEGVLAPGRSLEGDSDARLIAQILTQPRFAPLLALLTSLDVWCRGARRRHRSFVAPELLTVGNAELFGPLVAEVFTGCAAAPDTPPDPNPNREDNGDEEPWTRRGRQYQDFLDLFLRRLRRDLRSSWFDDPALCPPLTELRAHGAESHNGGQRVLRLRMAGGGRVAYKPRPTGGEALFLAESVPDAPKSVFGLLNTLPPVSGQVQLPLLRQRSGRGRDRRAYSWQEWIEPPAHWGTLRRSTGLRLAGTRLGRREAPRFWHRAGSLAAACFGFGIADLGEGNLLTGTRPGATAALLYPVDLEIFLLPLRRLHDTGLIADPDGAGHHHPGMENSARWCTVDGPAAYFTAGRGGGLELRTRSAPCARSETRNVVAETNGRTGYGPHLPAFLRGMFDAWTLMCRNQGRLNELIADGAEQRFVRVLPHPTAVYTDALAGELLAGMRDQDAFAPAEREQMRRGDVPYFFRAQADGPLLCMEPPPRIAEFTALPGPDPAAHGIPPVLPRSTVRLELAGLGVALRDAVEYVFDDVGPGGFDDPANGTRIRLSSACEGEVAFDWRQAGRRIVYSWDRTTVRLRIEPFRVTVRNAAISRRLLRLDRVDAALRERWTAGGFTDAGTEERLGKITDTALAWLMDVIREHGWPGRALVGERAAEAACRLVQHARGAPDLLRECLDRMEQAAADGDIPWRHVAFATDAVRLSEGGPQLYGTKFRRGADGLEPCPIERPEAVDERRRQLGMEPLARYAVRIRRRFPAPAAEDA